MQVRGAEFAVVCRLCVFEASVESHRLCSQDYCSAVVSLDVVALEVAVVPAQALGHW